MRKILLLVLLLASFMNYPINVLASSISIGGQTKYPTSTVVKSLQKTDVLVVEKEDNPYEFTTGIILTDISNANIEIFFDGGFFEGKEFSIRLVSPENLGDYSNTSEAFKVGLGNGIIRKETYGNLFITAHSGYLNSDINKPLEAEVFRFALEEWGEKDRTVEKNMKQIPGTRGTVIINKVPFKAEITGIVRLMKEESDYINIHPTEALDIITKKIDGKYLAQGNPSAFEKIKKNSHELLLSFCGWGPGKDTSYYRYVFLIKIEENYIKAPFNVE